MGLDGAVDQSCRAQGSGDDPWQVVGAGSATVYRKNAKPKTTKHGGTIDLAAAATTSR